MLRLIAIAVLVPHILVAGFWSLLGAGWWMRWRFSPRCCRASVGLLQPPRERLRLALRILMGQLPIGPARTFGGDSAFTQ